MYRSTANGTATTSADITATGVYPCYTNIGNGTLIAGATTKCDLTSGAVIEVDHVPSELVADRHFVFEYPSGRTCTFQIWSGADQKYVDYSATYTEDGTPEHAGYKRLETTGQYQGPDLKYKFTLSKSLNS